MNRRLMLDWIRDCDERGLEMPADAAIVDRFGFTSPDQARTLLADLADRGEITLRGAGSDRQILLGRVRSSFMPSKRPEPSVTGTDRAVDRGVEKIKAIVARTHKPATTAGARAAQASAALSVTRAAPAAEPPLPPVKSEPAREAVPVRSPIVSRAESRQVNSRLSAAHHAELERRAVAEGVSISSYASMLLAALLDRPGKPFLPVGALAFARDAGQPLHAFATMLMERGLRDYVSGGPSACPWDDDDVPGIAGRAA